MSMARFKMAMHSRAGNAIEMCSRAAASLTSLYVSKVDINALWDTEKDLRSLCNRRCMLSYSHACCPTAMHAYALWSMIRNSEISNSLFCLLALRHTALHAQALQDTIQQDQQFPFAFSWTHTDLQS